MTNKGYDKVVIGALTGVLVPVLAFGMLYVIFDELSQLDLLSNEGFSAGFRMRTISLVSIGVNAVLIRYYQNRFAFNAVRGVVIPTFAYIIAWIIYFSSILL
jgi:hypothetical protein